MADGSFWIYEYDVLGQVKSGKKYWSDWTPVAGQQFEYSHDEIGNRTETKTGGDENGLNLRRAGYVANNLNQYSSRNIPGFLDVMGITFGTNTVTVNSQTPYRRGEYFRKELSVANASAPVWQAVTVATNGVTGASGNVFLAQTNEVFGYDLDGNLTNDSRWNYMWDGENRLIRMVARNTSPAVGPQQRIDFEYDWRGRRIGKKVWNNVAGSGSPAVVRKFIYDGWNLIVEMDGNDAMQCSYMWGLDLSGSLEGAGGVGGLLKVQDLVTTKHHFVGYDGNGNVSALADGSNGQVTARYEYGPFGEVIRATGPMAKVNPFRFSTKYQDDESDLVYYGFRYYNPSTGRWLIRDPLGESGFEVLRRRKSDVFGDGPNLYQFVRNAPVHVIDAFGLTRVESGTWFPGSSFDGVIYWADVDDGQTGTVTLNRVTMAEVEAEMRDLVNQLNGFRKQDGCKSRKYEGGFDSKYFAGEKQQHQYYLVDGQGPLYADNEINYIGIGLYEAW